MTESGSDQQAAGQHRSDAPAADVATPRRSPAVRPFRRLMSGRAIDEEHRASTPLELLFDLCFVVAVAQAAIELHHSIAAGHALSGVGHYAMVFFAIWWGWMNFTWFASAYDTDDVPYRLLVLVQLAGVLVLAAGIPAAYEDSNFMAVTIGYVLLRIAGIALWLRASREHQDRRLTAQRMAAGITLVQVGWLLRLLLPGFLGVLGFLLLVVAEIAVPIWAERAGRTPWHPGHIAERYGLFTLIVLGECVLASTNAMQAAVQADGVSVSMLVLAAGGLLLIFGLWWSYFKRPAEDGLRQSRNSAFVWGYGHFLIFAAVAAVGSGLEVAAEAASHHDTSAESAGEGGAIITAATESVLHVSTVGAAFAVAVPVAITLVTLGALQSRLAAGPALAVRFAVAGVLTLVAAATAWLLPLALAVLLIALVVWSLIVADLIEARRALA